MDKNVFDYLMHRAESHKDYRDGRRSHEYDDERRARRDYKDYRDSRDSRDYEDGRRGRRDYRDYEDTRGRGSVDFEGSMDFADRDYAKSPKLSKTDIHHWKQMMENEDGTHGPHYDMRQITEAADKIGIDFDKDDFDEKEFYVAVNMMYSDYCKVAKKFVAPDKELAFFAELAKAFLDDEDGPGASAKLALYFHCIVDA